MVLEIKRPVDKPFAIIGDVCNYIEVERRITTNKISNMEDEEKKKHFIGIKKRDYIIRGIQKDISVKSTEDYRIHVLKSSDRKGYDVKTTVSYLDDEMVTMTSVQPFASDEEAAEIIREIESESKHRFAAEIYKKYFEN